MSVLRLWLLKAVAVIAVYLVAPIEVRAQANAKAALTPEGVATFMKFYYRQPQPEQLAPVIQAALAHGMAETRAKRLALIAFMAGAISADADVIDRLAPVFAKLPDDQPQRLMRAIAYSGRSDWKEQMGRLKRLWPDKAEVIDRIAASDGKAVFQLKREGQPEVLDMNWAYFHATGRREPIMTVIDWLGDLTSTDRDKVATAHAARLSLLTQSIEHERVFDVCLHSQWGSFGNQLRTIVAAAQTKDTSRIAAETAKAMQAASSSASPPPPTEAQVLTAKSRRP